MTQSNGLDAGRAKREKENEEREGEAQRKKITIEDNDMTKG